MTKEEKNTPKRRVTRRVKVGTVAIGGGAPVTVQSMLNTRTTDIDGCVRQIEELSDAGCDLIRLAVPDEASAEAFGKIAKATGKPLIADIHYSCKLAHLAIDGGAKKIRMNPGNMHNAEEIRELARRMADEGIPVRVGVNGGSRDPKFDGKGECEALVESALECANVFESCNMHDIVVAVKASDVRTMIAANRALAAACDYPLHLGVTEAGTLRSGLVKSALGIGILLEEGIGGHRAHLSLRLSRGRSAGMQDAAAFLGTQTGLRGSGIMSHLRAHRDRRRASRACGGARDCARPSSAQDLGDGLSSQRHRRGEAQQPRHRGRQGEIGDNA